MPTQQEPARPGVFISHRKPGAELARTSRRSANRALSGYRSSRQARSGVRARTIDNFKRNKQRSAVDALMACLGDRDSEMRVAAAEALAAISGEVAASALFGHLED